MALSEGRHAAEFLASEAEYDRSRDAVTVLSGQNLTAGTVVGRVKYGIGRVSVPTVVGTGNGTVSAVFAGPDCELGNYVATCTSAVTHGGVWSITSPSGLALPTLTMTPGAGGTTVYTSTHINFSITDGSTDFAANDVFTFVVSTTAPTVVGGTGTGTISALALGPDAKPGNYKIINRAVVTNGGDFEVIAPDGTSIGRFIMGTGSGAAATFTTQHITFTLTDATDFILDNYFNVAVFNQLVHKVAAWSPRPTTYDGRQRVAGVVLDNYDATGGDVDGVIIARDAEVVSARLQWLSGLSTSDQASGRRELSGLGIVAR